MASSRMQNARGTPLGRGQKSESHRIDVKALKENVGNDWLSLLRDLAPELEEACDEFPEHVACPMHGGSDGFRFFDDAEETGGAVCNTCGSFSDGIDLLMALKEWTFTETLQKIQEWLDDDDEESDVRFLLHFAFSMMPYLPL